jgi:hypothetical protein
MFEHCNRKVKEVAHELARFSFNDRSYFFWDDDPSSFIFPKLTNDITLFENQ